MRHFPDLKKNALYADLWSSIQERFDRDETPQSLAQWAESAGLILDGKPFSFTKHEYLRAPYDDDHPHIAVMKATQGGWSTFGILRSIYSLRFRGFKGIGYYFPSKADVIDFSRSRVDPLIEENPETLGAWLRDTDSAQLKRIGSGYIYFRGMISTVGLKSIPLDALVLDELDEGNQTAIDKARERMAHSAHKEILMLSNPTIPDFGIDKAFQLTDQRTWLLKCRACGHWTDLVEGFPGCLVELRDRTIRACEQCRGELDPSVGGWIPKKPAVTERRGYQWSQLHSHYVDPGEILHQFRTTNNLQDFNNLKLGLPYIDAHNRLSVEEVLACCGSDGIASSDPGPCYMGVDQGKGLHVVVGRKHPSKAGRIVHLGEYCDWSEFDGLMRNFTVTRCVVDAMPEVRNARAFALRFPGRVFLNYYSETHKGRPRWDEGNLTVVCNRTESLDASGREIHDGQIVLPKQCEVVEEFTKHCHAIAKRLEEDEETGSKVYRYVRLGADHFRHAFNYESLARRESPQLLFPGL